MSTWGVVFGIGVIVAVFYYVLRQSKDLGVNIFPHNVIETADTGTIEKEQLIEKEQ